MSATISHAAPLSLAPDELDKMIRYWEAANYLSVGQIYLMDNALLREPLRREHIKPRLLGHFGTVPGLNMIYAQLNRLIKKHQQSVLYIAGPGHGGPALVANVFMEGTYSEVYPRISTDNDGIKQLFRQFSTPGGIPSHVSPECPGSIHEGGELGYALVHAFGAAFDHPDLLVACVIGDGEAETGPLEGGWKGNKFLNPVTDGAVLPILHLNGYKISGPCVYARIPDDELVNLMRGHGYEPMLVEGDDPEVVFAAFAAALEKSYAEIRRIQHEARTNGFSGRPTWPMIVLRTPKGWTGPKEVDGIQVEGTYRSHQVPLAGVRDNDDHRRMLEEWLRSYGSDRHFDDQGRLVPELAALAPEGDLRMGATPYANGGRLLTTLDLPSYSDYALDVPAPGSVTAEAPRKLGEYLRDVFKRNQKHRNFRLFCPDETNSNRLGSVFEATNRCSVADIHPDDDHVASDGRVMEVLSEHCCQGWLEGYLLSGRHGLFPTYEAFAMVIDSMLNQHAKWLKVTRHLHWRRPIASLNYLLTSHAWRNDHNGYSHQGPGFIDVVLTKKGTVTRVYFPPDGNCLMSVADHCLRSRNYINLIVCGKQRQLQWLDIDQAREHCSKGAGVWDFASNDQDGQPDVVLACAGDVPTIEAVAASWLLQRDIPDLKVRLVNVVDLMTLYHPDQHPHGFDDLAFNELFTKDKPVIFAFHGYPRVVHDLVHGRSNEGRFHARGYIEEGTTTTPFDMVVLNNMSRYQLAIKALQHVPRLRSVAADIAGKYEEVLADHERYSRSRLEDLPEVNHWQWTSDFRDPEGLPSPASAVSRQAFTDA
ncbi:Xylulose-5-phosphate phosphoketolase [Planctomycetes bacterium Pan216]|uniref:Xylulose-5-phosphate phosphoketolase n=1 Tax=Kolteria novifilia TaxID=2527975 RepID=A0A518BC14_9BACT|nr:Xylulose-5-phosphate phosphoketolase [Planctomycetes bacterium Pan216]